MAEAEDFSITLSAKGWEFAKKISAAAAAISKSSSMASRMASIPLGPWPYGTILETPDGREMAMHIAMDYMMARAIALNGANAGLEIMIAPEEWRVVYGR